jgi:hypothetical protein
MEVTQLEQHVRSLGHERGWELVVNGSNEQGWRAQFIRHSLGTTVVTIGVERGATKHEALEGLLGALEES